MNCSRLSTAGETGRARLASLALGVAVFAVFASAAGNRFVNLDDAPYIYENSQVRRGLTVETARWALTSTELANWYPLTRLSHLMDVSLFGMWAGGHHLVSAAWHAAAAALLFLALRQLTGAAGRCLVVASLFGVHPLQVESVAWAAERSNVLAGFFCALTLLLWARHVRQPGAGRYGAALAAFAAGLAAKPVLVTLPFLLLLLDVWPLGRAGVRAAGAARLRLGALLLEKAPLLALATAGGAVTLVAQTSGGTLPSLVQFPLGIRLGNAALSYWRYLGKLLWPAGLAVYYPHPGEELPFGRAAVAALLVVGVTAGAVRWARRRPWLTAGWLWYLGGLVPMIGIVQTGSHALADRFVSLSSVGIFLAAVWTAPVGRPGRASRPILLGCAALAALVALAAASVRQVGRWRDEETLYRHTLTVTSRNWIVESNLGAALINRQRYAEALEHLLEAVRLEPGNDDAHNNLGVALMWLGRDAEAEASYRRALAIAPGHGAARANLADILARRGRTDEAIAAYRQALASQPDFAEAHFRLANVLAAGGRERESIASYRQALRLNPDADGALNNLAWLLATDPAAAPAQAREAAVLARRACELSGYRNHAYLETLAEADAVAGNFAEAVAVAERAVAVAREAGDAVSSRRIAESLGFYRSGKARWRRPA